MLRWKGTTMEPRYTYEVYEILHGDWKGVVPEGAFRAEGRPGWLVPDSTLQDIADAYTAFIVISDRGGTASLEAKLAFAKVLTTLDTLVDIAELDALEGTDNE